MKCKTILALCGTLAVAVCGPAGSALAAGGTNVTVRIEGRTRTLLTPTAVHTHSGWITKGGAASGACTATSAAGALDVATHHRWSGSFSTSFSDYLIDGILGDTESGKSYYWGIWINNKYATAGACGLKLHRGDQLLFAVDSVAKHEHPLGLSSVAGSHVGHTFTVKVVSYSDSGTKTPLAGARVSGGGVSAVTNAQGVATVNDSKTGTLALDATDGGYIRSAALRVHVA